MRSAFMSHLRRIFVIARIPCLGHRDLQAIAGARRRSAVEASIRLRLSALATVRVLGSLLLTPPNTAEAGWLEFWDIAGSKWYQYSCGTPFPTTGV